MKFIVNARAMLSGAMLAQVIVLATSPLLTRLFDPEAFGLQALFMGVVAVLSVICSLKLDVALVLAEDEQEETDLLQTTAFLAVVSLTVIAIIVGVFGNAFSKAIGHEGESGWLWLILPMLATLLLTELGVAVLSRGSRFRPIAASRVITQAVFVLSALAIWSSAHLFPSDNNLGLVWARVLGQVATVAVLAWMVFGAFQRIRLPNMATFKRVWRRFHQFVIFNSPYSLIGTLGRDMMLYALAIFSTTLAVGLYGLARSLLLVPTSLLAASLRQVFYREAFEAKGTRRLEDLTVSLLHTTAITTAPLFGFVVVWGELLFSTVFGQAWAVAGLYAMVLAPATWMSVLTSWPDRLFEVSGRQNVSFGVQVTSDVACAFAAVIPLMLGAGSLVAIGCYAVVNVCQHALYLFAAFRVSRMSATRLALTLARGWGVFAAAVAVFALARLIPAQELILAGGCAILAAATAARHAFHGLRAVTVMMSASSEEEQ